MLAAFLRVFKSNLRAGSPLRGQGELAIDQERLAGIALRR